MPTRVTVLRLVSPQPEATAMRGLRRSSFVRGPLIDLARVVRSRAGFGRDRVDQLEPL